jgi:hypothetical protein
MGRTLWSLGNSFLLFAVCSAPTYAESIRLGWAQPGGPGSPVTITYSYSNLFDGGFNSTLTPVELRQSTEVALGVWARYAPLNFVETGDSGPSPSSHEYVGAYPDIRIGYQPRLSSGSAALAYFPLDRSGSEATGLSGDIHFSNDLSAFHAFTWGRALDGATALDFFSVMLHEAGHALGIQHIFGEPAIVSGHLVSVFTSYDSADLKPADIRAIRALYGSGAGSVQPLIQAATTPEPGTIVLLSTGLAAALYRRRRRASGSPTPAFLLSQRLRRIDVRGTPGRPRD